MTRFVKWTRLVLRWLKMLTGQSYYHRPQRLGKAFCPGELAGYFNDLTVKTCWNGYSDEEGIPINILVDGRKIYFPTTIAQKALGHWDNFLLTKSEEEKREFLKLCWWLIKHQDERGGWPLPVSWVGKGNVLSPYSAMTQGEGISALVRAWKLTGDAEFAMGAKRALQLMCTPAEQGGTAVIEKEQIFLEEVPAIPRSSILNGWIFAIFGLYDFWLAFNDKKAFDLFMLSVNTLKRHLPEYDSGYWSNYDRQGNLASPFYHDLHIHQLSALAMVVNEPIFAEYRERWISYQKIKRNYTKAFVIKAIQKLREPGEVVIIK